MRRRATAERTARLAAEQGGRCAYCGWEFGAWVRWGTRVLLLQPVTDHFVPWALVHDDSESNQFAACEICNLIKSGTVFTTFEAAREYIAEGRRRKGVVLLIEAPRARSETVRMHDSSWSDRRAASRARVTAREGLCRLGLHSMRDETNVHVDSLGVRRCRQCRRDGWRRTQARRRT